MDHSDLAGNAERLSALLDELLRLRGAIDRHRRAASRPRAPLGPTDLAPPVLTPAERRVLRLRHAPGGGLSCAAIAARTGMSRAVTLQLANSASRKLARIARAHRRGDPLPDATADDLRLFPHVARRMLGSTPVPGGPECRLAS